MPRSKFYHGDKNPPSQIKLLAEAHVNYRDLYDVEHSSALNKNDDARSVQRYKLKRELTVNDNTSYYSLSDIRHDDLEKKNRTGSQLVTGRNFYDMAVRGMKSYKKAQSFVNDVWNMNALEPKKSGDSIEDCINYVVRKMYTMTVTSNKGNDDEPEGEFDAELESEEVLPSTMATTSSNNSREDNAEISDDVNTESSPTPDAVDKRIAVVDDSDEDVDIPHDFIFPSFFVFYYGVLSCHLIIGCL